LTEILGGKTKMFSLKNVIIKFGRPP